MSYNIDNVECTVLDAWMYAKDVKRLHRKYESDMAECNFLSEMLADADGPATSKVPLPNLWWYGVYSGRSYDVILCKKLAPHIHGKVEAIFTWEDGDTTSGLIIEDGKVTECDVEMTQKPKRSRK